jgi:TM2 domain-containing membrane protein YozV
MAMVFCRGCGKEIHETAPFCPHCGYQQVQAPIANLKSQSVATLLAAFLGGLGIHRFYLDRPVSGVLYLLFCWTGVPNLISFVETLIFAFTGQQTWAAKYNNGRISEPVHVAIKILVLIFPIVFVIGILAAIAIPAYHGYVVRSHHGQGV